MKARIFGIFLAFVIMMSVPQVYAEPSVSIVMEKTTYNYCEKLFYTIKVSEVTSDSAIIHIRDQADNRSSAIPIQIIGLETPVPSQIAFDAQIFQPGKYFIDLQYSGVTTVAEFDLVESDAVCISELMKPIIANWLSEKISDGFLMSAFQKYVSVQLVDIPIEINEGNIYEIDIPKWVKYIAYWWMIDEISDDVFAQALNYLIDESIISFPIETEDMT